jgi:hypothetical protein
MIRARPFHLRSIDAFFGAADTEGSGQAFASVEFSEFRK